MVVVPTPIQLTSTTSIPRSPTADWTIEEVINFISTTDPTLAVHAELFRRHVSL